MTLHAIPIPVGMTPREAKTFGDEYRRLRSLRSEIEQTIERMVDLLDSLDGDPDLEPSLGASEVFASGYFTPDPATSQERWAEPAPAAAVDLEEEHDGLEPDDSGIGDADGLAEQCAGVWFLTFHGNAI